MAYIDPKTDWKASDAPKPSDFNRQEGNVEFLKDSLDTEISTRSSADSTLQSNINAEAATRASADNTLQSNINAEAAARASADSTLQTNINNEANTRESADSTLQNQINNIKNIDSIGSVAFCRCNTNMLPGDLIVTNGLNLRYSNVGNNNTVAVASGQTWRCLGRAVSTSDQNGTTLFVRIS